MKKNILKVLNTAQHNIKPVVDVGLEAIAGTIAKYDQQNSLQAEYTKGNQILASLEQLIILEDHFSTFGCDPAVMAVVNNRGQLDKLLHLTPEDTYGKSNHAVVEIYQAGFFGAIRDAIVAAYKWIMGLIRKILGFIKDTLNVVTTNQRKTEATRFIAKYNREHLDPIILPEELCYDLNKIKLRLMNLMSAFGEMQAVVRQIESNSGYKMLKSPAYKDSIISSIRDSLRNTATIADDGTIHFNAMVADDESKKTIGELGWSGRNVQEAETIAATIDKRIGDTGNKLNTMALVARRDYEALLNTNTVVDTAVKDAYLHTYRSLGIILMLFDALVAEYRFCTKMCVDVEQFIGSKTLVEGGIKK